MTWERYVCVSAGTDGLIDWPSSIWKCKHCYEVERDYLIYNLLLKYLIKIFWRQDLNPCRTMNYSYQFIVLLFIYLVILLFSFLSFLNHMSSYIYIYMYLYMCMCIVISEFYYRYTNFFMLVYFQVIFKNCVYVQKIR